ncbi:MAG: aminotransferase class I/II-fold pyridoxal phosphate-dependent enzyme [Bacteroidetes bacterium]|nr:aminotransferase class I/II-fold pyridoxal phosphate-dependent enzyme [Bacteroidota bacterium]
MNVATTPVSKELIISDIAENIIGSEILKLAWEVNDKIKKGEKIYNLTIGDFNPKIFPIPAELKREIIAAYENGETNYPPAEGVPELRNAVCHFLNRLQGFDFKPENIIIACGARPVIYSIYKTILDPGDTVIFPVPSWNNNHYVHLSSAKPVLIETSVENYFMPSAVDLKKHIKNATLISLCSPLNPTGTTFSKETLAEICDLILEENARRENGQKPLYLMYDQIYWTLTFGNTKHYDPVSLRPEMKDYTIFVDGISKAFAATGVRVGWGMGPKKIVDKMKSMLGHIGAWAPRPEQMATARYLMNDSAVDGYLSDIRKKVNDRLVGFHKGFQSLKNEGFKVDSIAPQAAIYLTVQFSLHGQKTSDGKILSTTKDVTKYILDEAKVALVPFYAFGASEESSWYRLSVGTCRLEDVDGIIMNLRNALNKLTQPF